MIVICASNFATAILIEVGLSFLGIGVQIPMPSWGSIIDQEVYIIHAENFFRHNLWSIDYFAGVFIYDFGPSLKKCIR